MSDQPEFKLRVIELLDPQPETEALDEANAADLGTTAQEMFETLQAYEGASEFLAEYPEFERAATWQEIGFFNECEIRGTIQYRYSLRAASTSNCRYWFNFVDFSDPAYA